MVIVKCGWCRENFEVLGTRGKHGYKVLTCSNCGRTVNSSIKEPIENIVGRKHIHRDLKDGDVV